MIVETATLSEIEITEYCRKKGLYPEQLVQWKQSFMQTENPDEDRELLKKRDELYRQAQKAHPERWPGKTRNWQPKGSVTLNPEREKQAA